MQLDAPQISFSYSFGGIFVLILQVRTQALLLQVRISLINWYVLIGTYQLVNDIRTRKTKIKMILKTKKTLVDYNYYSTSIRPPFDSYWTVI